MNMVKEKPRDKYWESWNIGFSPDNENVAKLIVKAKKKKASLTSRIVGEHHKINLFFELLHLWLLFWFLNYKMGTFRLLAMNVTKLKIEEFLIDSLMLYIEKKKNYCKIQYIFNRRWFSRFKEH
jgi:hypothetical protein